tara:strand:- start:85 stop:462 length:378 start_codon:yes stop_codon:yes gene_type:complete
MTKIEVSSWSDLLKKAKKENESLGDAMKRLGGRWKKGIRSGTDPEFVLGEKPASSGPSKRTTRRKKSKRRSGRPGKTARSAEKDDASCPSSGGKGDVQDIAKAIRSLMKSCGVCPRAVATAILDA